MSAKLRGDRATLARVGAGGCLAGSLLLACAVGGCDTFAEGPVAPPEGAETARFEGVVEQAELRERALRALVTAGSDPDPAVRANAVEAVAPEGERGLEVVRGALADPNEGVRAVAAMVVGRHGLSALLEPVSPLTLERSPFVRSSAIYALRANGVAEDPTPLAAFLLENPSTRVRAHTAFLLGELGEPSASAMLRSAYSKRPSQATDLEVRLMQLQIAEALAKLGDASQRQAIQAAMFPEGPGDLELTALAAQIVGVLREKSLENQLVYLTAYWDAQQNYMPAEVRLAAARSLAQLGQGSGGFIADEHVSSERPAIRAQAAMVYGAIGDKSALGTLDRLLRDESALVRVAAARAVLDVLSR